MRALFFLRHYNDIDHMTPVIAKWIESGHSCDVVLLGKTSFKKDFRVEYLRKLTGVRVAHVRDVLPIIEFVRWRLQMLLLVRSSHNSIVGPLVKLIANFYNIEKRQPIWQRTANRLLARTFNDNQQGVMAFDWIERNSAIGVEWVETMISVARNRGLGTVSLPHGDSPHASQLIRRGEWQLKPDVSYSGAGLFDQVVVPNELCSERFRSLFDDHKIAVLGSPRYCDEWLLKLGHLLPPSPLTKTENQLKVVMFLRKENFTTFWEEVEEVVQLIAAFPRVTLMIKLHTRGGWKQSLTGKAALKKLPNVIMVGDAVHSAHLMDWADVIIDLATSVVFEAVRNKKPVLAADYLHAGRSALAKLIPETELRCRDDVYQKIDSFIKNGCNTFYVEAHHQRFVQEMLDVGGADVLPRYVSLLEKHAQKK